MLMNSPRLKIAP